MAGAPEPALELEPSRPATPELPPRGSPAVKVLYIGGAARSGSTLLDRILDRIPGLCSVGELVHLMRRGVVDNELCGCGSRFRDCRFWSRVGHEAFGGWRSLEAARLLRLQRAVDRTRFIPLMENPGLASRHARKAQAYGRYLLALYRGIQRVSGSPVIVDSTKHASTAFLLSGLPSVDLRLVHLVRDSRGVAYSWMKRVRKPEVIGRRAYMPRHHPARSGADWMMYNALFHRLARRGPSVAMRYEALVTDPRRQVEQVLRLVGIDPADVDLSFIHEDSVELVEGHSVAGNPMRFQRGRVHLSLDDDWRRQMRPHHRALVSAITWPSLARYGYAVTPSREGTVVSR